MLPRTLGTLHLGLATPHDILRFVDEVHDAQPFAFFREALRSVLAPENGAADVPFRMFMHERGKYSSSTCFFCVSRQPDLHLLQKKVQNRLTLRKKIPII
jgi:hypothetical protein